jgi:hypothetical protein
LKLAIELNGILNFKPICGSEKLEQIQKIDREKAERCLKAGIKLYIIDVSTEPYLTQEIKEKHWKTFKELVTSRWKCAGHTDEQVS